MTDTDKPGAAGRRNFLRGSLAGGLLLPGGLLASDGATRSVPGRFNVRDFGATGTGRELDTKPLQAAIDACAAAGGGVVQAPAGTYLSGTLFLRSNFALVFEPGAVLRGSPNLADYPAVQPRIRSYTDTYVCQSLLYGEDVNNVAILGQGVLDGQGGLFKGQPYRARPYLIRLVNCANVEVAGIELRDSAMWVQHYLACSDLWLHGVTVRSVCNNNNDGIDIDSCERVRISDCDIDSGDDAVCLKSTTERPCCDVVVDNCVIRSKCNAVKLGTESVGGFRNISITNCAIHGAGLAGLALLSVDGGGLENVVVSNLAMRNVTAAIFLRLGNRARPAYEGAPEPGLRPFRGVMISSVQADGAGKLGSALAGLPGHLIEDVTLRDVAIRTAGGGPRGLPKRELPEKPESYPECNMFGILPAFGLYCRHVRGLRFDNVRLSVTAPEERPGLMCDDVDGVTLTGIESANTDPVLWFRNTRRALLVGNRAPEGNRVYLHAEGPGARDVQLAANDLTASQTPVETD